jgi:hypothetical protein
MDYAAIVVVPRPVVRSDSSARADFGSSAIAILDRVAKRNGLRPYRDKDPESAWSECLQHENFSICAGPRDSLIEVRFREWARFSPLANNVQREVAESLRAEFGARWVRECDLRHQRMTCPTLAQIDSAR